MSWIPLLALSTLGTALAGDDPKTVPFDPKNPIVVDDPDEFDALLAALYKSSSTTSWPNWPLFEAEPQLWEGVHEIIAPNGGPTAHQGTIVSNKLVDGTWTEDWFLRQPETVMPIWQHWVSTRHTTNVDEVWDLYAGRSDADQFQHMQVAFSYKSPLPDAEILALPDFLSWFVRDVQEYQVFTTDGVTRYEAGALHRERWVFASNVTWKDTWVLWDNFTIDADPEPLGPRHEVELVPVTGPDQTMKAFLWEQRGNPQKWHVTTSGTFKAL